ncbi:uncharacterized protein LAESUDRAFT_760796 [Laetiporus sulphureus 93-53]|uniref:Uncharacterized protein n=1 Tax=Laetiporus sulphureus 93-53 TaxID=1314785 RepID=A0A165DF82_9APHY|nr:uncharacterized protein LAESUDRAFT_760796 [Laetiporus sulphureus 93-53]KZT04764.1 hypothetical protein LAESUDRAFT_760796 [Laetiporus sulphureus 93-53]
MARDAAKVNLTSLSKPIKPLVAAEIERDNLGKKQTLAVIKRVTREVFEKESEEVKAEIQAKIDMVEDAHAGMADSEPSPLQHQL